MRFCSLKIGRDRFFKAAGVVLSRCESTCLWIEIPSRVQSGRHGLTYPLGSNRGKNG